MTHAVAVEKYKQINHGKIYVKKISKKEINSI